MKKVLIIAYDFPPILSSGTFRPLKFVKYLPEFGWLPFVLSVRTSKKWKTDFELCDEIPNDVKIKRVRCFGEKYIQIVERILKLKHTPLGIPDNQIGFLLPAVYNGYKIIKTEKIDAIFTTSDPYTSAIVGLILRYLTGIPCISDFRDPWTLNLQKEGYVSLIHKNINEFIEMKVLSKANYIIAVTQPMIEDFKMKCPKRSVKRFVLIPNGYDLEDFNKIKLVKNIKFTIVYTGKLYYSNNSMSFSPVPFFTALRELISEMPEIKSQINVLIAGPTYVDLLKNQIKEFELEEIVFYLGVVPYRKSIQLMKNANVLLLLSSITGNTDHHAKLFSYIVSENPILALVPEGPASELIQETNSGIVVPPDIVANIKKSILELYTKYKMNTLKTSFKYDTQSIQAYDRKNLTKKLSNVLDKAIFENKL